MELMVVKLEGSAVIGVYGLKLNLMSVLHSLTHCYKTSPMYVKNDYLIFCYVIINIVVSAKHTTRP